MKKKILLLILLNCLKANTQYFITETVHEKGSQKTTLPGANVYWLDTDIAEVTDIDGNYEIELATNLPAKLIAGYNGYTPDTILITIPGIYDFTLNPSVDLKEVEVTSRTE